MAVFLALALAWRPWPLASAQPVNPNAATLKRFADRIEEYAKLHERFATELPPLKNDAEAATVAAHQRALAARIRAARRSAEQGDVFTRETRALFRRLVRAALKEGDTSNLRGAIQDENPGLIRLRVNASYPENVPASRMPLTVLKALPRLPDGLEYRFVGRHLILRDERANLIVDYITNVL